MLKITSDEAKKLFETCPYISEMKNALKVIKSENVYDVFAQLDDIYESKKENKNVHTFFQHVKSAYDNMSESQKQKISDDQLLKLKKYSLKSFYKDLQNGVDEESMKDDDIESQDGGGDDDSEEEISIEEADKDRKKLDRMNKVVEAMRNMDMKKKDSIDGYMFLTKLKILNDENMELKKTLNDFKKENEKALNELKKENEKILNILEIVMKGCNETTSKEICSMLMRLK